MKDIPLCKDCAHFIVGSEKCAQAPMPVDYVYGKERGFFSAQLNRESISGCGKDGRYFQHIPVAA